MRLRNVFCSGEYCGVPPSLRSNELDICVHSIQMGSVHSINESGNSVPLA